MQVTFSIIILLEIKIHNRRGHLDTLYDEISMGKRYIYQRAP